MRNYYILLAVLLLPVCALAQKTYVNIVAPNVANSFGHNIYLSGNLPEGVKNFYYDYGDRTTLGELINILAAKGFAVEQMACTSNDGQITETIIMSRNGSQQPVAIKHITANDSEDVKEVARYNLQGMPITPNEKGVQIVVYSNYTTRTIIVE